jgi:hypothetical protein
VVGWGRTDLTPETGLAVYVRGDSGKLAAARVYDDSGPPQSARAWRTAALAAAHSRSGANERKPLLTALRRRLGGTGALVAGAP